MRLENTAEIRWPLVAKKALAIESQGPSQLRGEKLVSTGSNKESGRDLGCSQEKRSFLH